MVLEIVTKCPFSFGEKHLFQKGVVLKAEAEWLSLI